MFRLDLFGRLDLLYLDGGAGHLKAEAAPVDGAVYDDLVARGHLGGALQAVHVAAIGMKFEESALEIVVADGAFELGHGREHSTQKLATLGSSMRVGAALLGWLVAATTGVFACGGTGASDGDADAAAAGEPTSPAAQAPTWPAWGQLAWPTGDDALATELLRAQLRRDPAAEAIDRAWHHESSQWRGMAATSLARIGGPTAVARMTEWLGDGRIELDAASLAAFALLEAPGADQARGTEWDTLEQRLWTRYAVAEAAAEADALLLAIARTGAQRSVRWLAADLSVRPEPADAAGVARSQHGLEALAILCTRGHALSPAAVESISRSLATPGPAQGAEKIRATAAYALGRCAAVSAEQLAGQGRQQLVAGLTPLLSSGDAWTRRRAWWAFEGLGELPAVVPGSVLGSQHDDWIAEVAAVRALAGHADGRKILARRLADLSLDNLVGPRLHALREVLERLRPFFAHEPELEAPVAALFESLVGARRAARGDEARSRALTLVRCEVQLLLAIRNGELAPLRACARTIPTHGELHGEALVIEALVHMGTALPPADRASMLLGRAGDRRPVVAARALAALASLDHPDVAATLRTALQHDDMGVVAAAAAAIGQRGSDQVRRDPLAVTELVGVVERFANATAIETRIGAIDALGVLARSTPKVDGELSVPPWLERSIVPLARDPASAVRAAARRALAGHEDLLARFDQAVPPSTPDAFEPAVHEAAERYAGTVTGLRLATERGEITIDFRGAPAPIAQANLAALAERGFFDGLAFHRVVPGFVTQGGDPRGDGYGGPGHVMPCEWSPLRYERGTVGVALAGKDTGGSQIFIAHEATRHLDARYTVIGRVSSGMEVVDALWPYDTITSVELLRP